METDMRILAALAMSTGLTSALVAPAFGQASRETLSDAVQSALANNPTILGQRKARGVADETLEQAKAGFRPTLGLNGSYGTQDQDLGQTFSVGGQTFPLNGRTERATVGLEARQTLYAGGALTAQRKQAEAGVTGAEARLSGAEQQLILDVVTAFMDVRRAEEEVSIRETNVSELRTQVQAASDRFDVGEVTRTDVAQAQARHAGSEADYSAAKARLSAARAKFERLVGRPAIQLAEPPAPPQIPGTLEQAVALAMANNPQVLTAKANETAAEQAINVAKGQLRPKVGLVGSAGLQETYQDRTFRDTNVGLSAQVTIPIYQGGLAASKTRGARLQSDQARYDRMAVERAVTEQVTTTWSNLIAAREAITASQSRVTAAEIALEGAQQELSVGTRITLDVLDQERELLEARLGLVDSERQAYIATHQLLATTGRLSSATIVAN
jgi:outer membrane protein